MTPRDLVRTGLASRRVTALLGAVLAGTAVVVTVVAHRDHGTSHAVSVSAGERTVEVRMTNMRFEPSRITVPAGTRLTLRVTDVDDMQHDLYIDGGPKTPLLSQGQSAILRIGPVTHTLQGWCTVPGHKAAGMTMTIAVTGHSATSGGMAAMPGMASTTAPGPAASIDAGAAPDPGWQPYDATLPPAPSATVHRVPFTIRDTRTQVAPGVWQTLWTYNGTAPGPILHGRVGDRFVVTIVNRGDMAHGIDFHAGSVAPDGPMRAIPPGGSLTYRFTAAYSGAWLYHCSTMPMALHIANGMYGAVIIDPPHLGHADQQLVFVQAELYLGRQDGIADETKIEAGKPDAVVFNGYYDQYDYAPIQVRAGERIRVWVVDAGPQFGTSFHVVGTQFDTVFKEGGYLIHAGNAEHGAAQTLDLAPGQGGFVEFTLPGPGHYPFVDHAMVDAERGAAGVLVAQ